MYVFLKKGQNRKVSELHRINLQALLKICIYNAALFCKIWNIEQIKNFEAEDTHIWASFSRLLPNLYFLLKILTLCF